jgi:hypothetical protein
VPAAAIRRHQQSSPRITTNRGHHIIEDGMVGRIPGPSGFPAAFGALLTNKTPGPCCHPTHPLGPLRLILHKFLRYWYVIFTY